MSASALPLRADELIAARYVGVVRPKPDAAIPPVVRSGWSSLVERSLASGTVNAPRMSTLLSQVLVVLFATAITVELRIQDLDQPPVTFSVHFGDRNCAGIHEVHGAVRTVHLVTPEAAFDFAKMVLTEGVGLTSVFVSALRHSGEVHDHFVVQRIDGELRTFDSMADYCDGIGGEIVNADALWTRFGACFAPRQEGH